MGVVEHFSGGDSRTPKQCNALDVYDSVAILRDETEKPFLLAAAKFLAKLNELFMTNFHSSLQLCECPGTRQTARSLLRSSPLVPDAPALIKSLRTRPSTFEELSSRNLLIVVRATTLIPRTLSACNCFFVQSNHRGRPLVIINAQVSLLFLFCCTSQRVQQ